MDMEPLLFKLYEENPKQLSSEIVKFLIDCCLDLLANPTSSRFLCLSVGDVKKMFSKIIGGIECLLYFGYQKGSSSYNLPLPLDTKYILEIQGELHKVKHLFIFDAQKPTFKLQAPKPVIPSKINFKPVTNRDLQSCLQTNHVSELELTEEAIACTNKVLKYEDHNLQKVASSFIPLGELNENVKKKCAQIKNGENLYRDLLIVELLNWFKTSFFHWFDTPLCNKCSSQMKNIGYGVPTEDDRLWEASRIELFSCPNCSNSEKRFPRYNHPGKLLLTREGRCGEWANCFGLLCRSLSYETRFVNDFKDHVWNEVFSENQNRWLHCDPCENLCDRPLIYESGWAKKPSYILAFSKDEMQDVTWRYTQNSVDVMRRRQSYREEFLLNLVTSLTSVLEYRIEGKQGQRRNLLVERRLVELVEFLGPQRDAVNDETVGRSSGSLAWKQARGESGTKHSKKYIFMPTQTEKLSKEIYIAYSPVTDKYIRFSDESKLLNNWENYVFQSKHITRKVEQDWKMAYLARQESTSSQTNGLISWKFDLSSTSLLVDRVSIMCQSATFESGQISWKLTNDDNKTVSFQSGANMLNITDFGGSSTLTLTAELSGGEGLNAWQHTQLFRVSLESTIYPFIVRITLK